MHFKYRDTKHLKVKGQKKIYQANTSQEKAGMTTIISTKVDFRAKTVNRDKEGYFIMIKVLSESRYSVSKHLCL